MCLCEADSRRAGWLLVLVLIIITSAACYGQPQSLCKFAYYNNNNNLSLAVVYNADECVEIYFYDKGVEKERKKWKNISIISRRTWFISYALGMLFCPKKKIKKEMVLVGNSCFACFECVQNLGGGTLRLFFLSFQPM